MTRSGRERPGAPFPVTGQRCSTTTAHRFPPARRAAGRQGPDRMPLSRRRTPVGLCAERLEPHRRHVHPGRRRLLLLPGPQRRHDRLVRIQHRRARRSRKPSWAHAPCWSAVSSAMPDAARGQVVTAYVVLSNGISGDDALIGAAGVRQRTDRALQVPASCQLRDQPAPHEHRQGAAFRIAAGAQAPHEDRRSRRRAGWPVLRRPAAKYRPPGPPPAMAILYVVGSQRSCRKAKRCTSAGAGARQAVDERATWRGYLYGAIARLTKVCSSTARRRLGRPSPAPRTPCDQLTAGSVREAHDAALDGRGMPQQGFLDLGAGDVVARRNDHVVVARLEAEVAVLVLDERVAGEVPPVLT